MKPKIDRGYALLVAQRFLGLRSAPATEVDHTPHLMTELRSVRPWEEFDEGIIRFSRVYTVPLVAAQFSALQLAVPSDPGIFIVILDTVLIFTAGEGLLRLNATAVVGAASVLGPSDQRWGPDIAAIPIQPTQGNAAAITGTSIALCPLNVPRQLGLILRPGGQNLTIWQRTLAADLNVEISGRLILGSN